MILLNVKNVKMVLLNKIFVIVQISGILINVLHHVLKDIYQIFILFAHKLVNYFILIEDILDNQFYTFNEKVSLNNKFLNSY